MPRRWLHATTKFAEHRQIIDPFTPSTYIVRFADWRTGELANWRTCGLADLRTCGLSEIWIDGGICVLLIMKAERGSGGHRPPPRWQVTVRECRECPVQSTPSGSFRAHATSASRHAQVARASRMNGHTAIAGGRCLDAGFMPPPSSLSITGLSLRSLSSLTVVRFADLRTCGLADSRTCGLVDLRTCGLTVLDTSINYRVEKIPGMRGHNNSRSPAGGATPKL